MGAVLEISILVGLVAVAVVLPVWVAPMLTRRRLENEMRQLGIVYCTRCDSPGAISNSEGSELYFCPPCGHRFDDRDYLPASLYQDPASHSVST